MKDGTCPKCDARAVHAVDGSRFDASIPVSTFRRVLLRPYICTACVYVEFYVDPAADRAAVAEHWPKVEPNDE